VKEQGAAARARGEGARGNSPEEEPPVTITAAHCADIRESQENWKGQSGKGDD